MGEGWRRKVDLIGALAYQDRTKETTTDASSDDYALVSFKLPYIRLKTL